MFDNTPSRLESAFVQRDTTNGWYAQVNISGSDIIFYHDSSGSLTADKISVWATKYGIGGGGGPSVSASWASSSISSSHALTASFALNGGGVGGSSNSASWASSSVRSLYSTSSITASY